MLSSERRTALACVSELADNPARAWGDDCAYFWLRSIYTRIFDLAFDRWSDLWRTDDGARRALDDFRRGRRKVVINNVVSVNSAPAALPREMQSDFVDAQPRAPRWEPLPEPRDRQALPPPNRSHDREPGLRTINPDPYDKAKWKALVEYDPDISRVVSALSPYGQKYVDQLATGYLALNDKSYLPMIVQKILATAKEDAARRA